MKRAFLAGLTLGLAVVSLAACQSPPAADAPPRTGGSTFYSVVGTPLLWIVKVPQCVATTVVLTPLVVGSAVIPTSQGARTQRDTGEIVEDVCARNWILTP